MFASMAPNIVGAPLVGVLADKMERKKLMLLSILLGAFVLLLLASLSLVHWLSALAIVILALIFGLASSAQSVSINAILPSLVPSDSLYNAYSLQALGQRGTEFVGPVLSSPLLAAFGPKAVYGFSSVAYLLALVLVTKMAAGPNLRRQSSREPFLAALRAGLSYIRGQRTIQSVAALVGFHCALTMAFLGMLPAFAHEIGAPSSFYGILMSMIGFGAIGSTLCFAGIKRGSHRRTLYWFSAVLSGLSISLLGLCFSKVLAIVAILVVGSSQALFMTLSMALIQETTEEHVRGRVTSVYFVLAAGLMSIANLGYGALATWVSPHAIMLVTGLLFIVVTGIVYGLQRQTMQPSVADHVM